MSDWCLRRDYLQSQPWLVAGLSYRDSTTGRSLSFLDWSSPEPYGSRLLGPLPRAVVADTPSCSPKRLTTFVALAVWHLLFSSTETGFYGGCFNFEKIRQTAVLPSWSLMSSVSPILLLTIAVDFVSTHSRPVTKATRCRWRQAVSLSDYVICCLWRGSVAVNCWVRRNLSLRSLRLSWAIFYVLLTCGAPNCELLLMSSLKGVQQLRLNLAKSCGFTS